MLCGGDVAVDHAQALAALAQRVRIVQPARDLGADLCGERGGKGHPEATAAFAQVPQRGATHVFHRQVVGLVVLSEVEDLHHVGVVQPRGEARLGDEQLHELLV
jgi:hypothetical protein